MLMNRYVARSLAVSRPLQLHILTLFSFVSGNRENPRSGQQGRGVTATYTQEPRRLLDCDAFLYHTRVASAIRHCWRQLEHSDCMAVDACPRCCPRGH
jgi:hypothetical protein